MAFKIKIVFTVCNALVAKHHRGLEHTNTLIFGGVTWCFSKSKYFSKKNTNL